MAFILRIDTDNAAFDDDCNAELARILVRIANELYVGVPPTPIRDINGNTVGSYSWDVS